MLRRTSLVLPALKQGSRLQLSAHFQLRALSTASRTLPQLSSTSFRTAPSALSRPGLSRLALPYLSVRTAASEVSGKPGSENLKHAATNAKEEVSNLAKDFAKTISGDPGHKGAHVGDGQDPAAVTRELDANSHAGHTNIKDDFLSVTAAVANNVPNHILYFGLAGALPYVGTSISTLYLARQAGQAASGLSSQIDIEKAVDLLEWASHAQVTYGAVLLSFLGALHWGMEFSGYSRFGDKYKGYSRLALGVAPLAAAWPTLTMEPQVALVAQWFIFTGMWYADQKATAAGWTPGWYSQYRFYLSVLVGTCILGTLFGLNQLAPTTDATLSKGLKETGVLGSGMAYMDFAVRDAVEASHHTKTVPKNSEVYTERDKDGFVYLRKRKEEGEDDEGSSDGESEGEESSSDSDGKSEGDEDGEGKGEEKESSEEDKGGDDSEDSDKPEGQATREDGDRKGSGPGAENKEFGVHGARTKPNMKAAVEQQAQKKKDLKMG